MSNLFSATYNPDVLSCLANLSNDEVFTPPEVVNQMLDMLPEEIWSDKNAAFLDPACKSGVFLREIAKRLIEAQLPNYEQISYEINEKLRVGGELDGRDIAFQNMLEDVIEHVFKNQVFGIAITELTSLLSRRSVYCSKYPQSEYSVVRFDNPEGRIDYKQMQHTWKNGKCVYCGASEGEYDREEGKEQYAYEFIHLDNPEEVFEMKFDVIIGNPPYQLQVNEAGKGLGAIPLYQKFVETAMSLKPRYLSMIIPARWYSGGVGLNDFRKEMLENGQISKIVDFVDSNECFPGVDINGGICYFLWQPSYSGKCEFIEMNNGVAESSLRDLSEFEIFIRRNKALNIVKKISAKGEKTLDSKDGCSPQTPYGLLSTFKGDTQKQSEDDLKVLSSKGWMFTPRRSITKSVDTIDMFKPMISKLSCEHAGNPDKNGMYRVLSRTEFLQPGEICTQSYLIVCPSHSEHEARNALKYLQTKFVRFLMLQTLAGQNISIKNFMFVPWQDFSKEWTDEELFKKYDMTQDEVAYIDTLIRPMESES